MSASLIKPSLPPTWALRCHQQPSRCHTGQPLSEISRATSRLQLSCSRPTSSPSPPNWNYWFLQKRQRPKRQWAGPVPAVWHALAHMANSTRRRGGDKPRVLAPEDKTFLLDISGRAERRTCIFWPTTPYCTHKTTSRGRLHVNPKQPHGRQSSRIQKKTCLNRSPDQLFQPMMAPIIRTSRSGRVTRLPLRYQVTLDYHAFLGGGGGGCIIMTYTHGCIVMTLIKIICVRAKK